MTPPQKALLAYLHGMVAVRKQCGCPAGFTYCGADDFLLKHGKWYQPAPWDDTYKQGVAKQCYGNAIVVGRAEGLGYVEGLAVIPAMPHFPFAHAWNVDAEGRALDVTWCNTGIVYFGVEFSLGRADDATWNGDSCVLNDYKRHHPLFKDPWPGEDFSRVWEPSEGWKLYDNAEQELGRKLTYKRSSHEKIGRGEGVSA